MIIVNVITDLKKGGAEALVQKIFHSESHFVKKTIYFSCNKENKYFDQNNEVCLSVSPRSPFAILKIRSELKNLLKQTDQLIVHAHLTWPLFFVAIASIGLKVTLVYTEHSTFNRRRNFPFLKFIDLFAYSRYTKIIGISQAASSSLINWLGPLYREKVFTIENGAELYQFIPRQNLLAGRKLQLLSVGSLKHLKGFETTIRSLEGVRDIVESYTIVGNGPDLESLQKLAKDCGVDDVVHFAGWSDNPESFYQNADALLIPSHWEGFGLVAVEGMSTGLPVIASNVEGLNEVVAPVLSSTTLISDFLNPEEWSDAIIDMKNKLSANAEAMSKESRKQAEKFDIKSMLMAYEELYKTLGEP